MMKDKTTKLGTCSMWILSTSFACFLTAWWTSSCTAFEKDSFDDQSFVSSCRVRIKKGRLTSQRQSAEPA